MALSDLMNSVFGGGQQAGLQNAAGSQYPAQIGQYSVVGSATGGGAGGGAMLGQSVMRPRVSGPVPIEDAKKPGTALTLSLNDVSMLWVQRFDESWVDEHEVATDPFWRVATYRLHMAGRLERLEAFDRGMPFVIFKMKEHDADR